MGKMGRIEFSRGFQNLSLMSSLIPIIMGYFELEIPLDRILEPTHPPFSQLSLSIEPYKYKLISIVEGENYRGIVMLLN